MNDQTQAEDRLCGLKERALELEAQLLHLLAGVRAAISETEEVAREARAEIRRRDFKSHRDTLQRLRKRHGLPHVQAGSLIRYTDEQLAQAVMILERPKRKAKP